MIRILLIDDDDFFRGMLRAVLEDAGHAVTEGRDGHEGLRLHTPGAFDLVITDLIMPEKEGIETIIQLRRRESALPIIAMSGGGRSSAEGYLQIARKVGATFALAKPFPTIELLAAVTRAAK